MTSVTAPGDGLYARLAHQSHSHLDLSVGKLPSSLFLNTPMLSRRPVISDLVHEFPQLAGSPAWTNFRDHDAQWSEFVRLVWSFYHQHSYSNVQAAFDLLEGLLDRNEPTIEAWIAGFLQALQEYASWHCDDREVFREFLGERTRQIWATLDAIRSDLANGSILEEDIAMWRLVHHWLPAPSCRDQVRPIS